jgi:hypothetical protein
VLRVQDSGFRVQYEHEDGNAGSSMQRARNPGYLMGCVLRDIFLKTAILNLNPEPFNLPFTEVIILTSLSPKPSP